MKRLRSLCMFIIICLVVVAEGAPVLAGKATGCSVPVEHAMVTTSSAGHERQDCGKTPCACLFGCAASCIAGTSLLVASAAEVPSFAAKHQAWPHDPTSLLGQWPPPDPFPPRT